MLFASQPLDSGQTWYSQSALGTQNFTGTAISPAGTEAMAVADGGYVYVYSANVRRRDRERRDLAALEQYPATPSGTWTVRLKELGPQRYSSCAMSANASAILVGTWGGYVYVSQVSEVCTENIQIYKHKHTHASSHFDTHPTVSSLPERWGFVAA